MHSTLTRKIAIVTGAASGLGRAIAERLAQAELAGLTIADITGAEAAAEDLNDRLQADVMGVATDVADASQVEAMESVAMIIQTVRTDFTPGTVK